MCMCMSHVHVMTRRTVLSGRGACTGGSSGTVASVPSARRCMYQHMHMHMHFVCVSYLYYAREANRT